VQLMRQPVETSTPLPGDLERSAVGRKKLIAGVLVKRREPRECFRNAGMAYQRPMLRAR